MKTEELIKEVSESTGIGPREIEKIMNAVLAALESENPAGFQGKQKKSIVYNKENISIL